MKKITLLTLTTFLILTGSLFAQHYALVGTAYNGGTNGYGTVFRYDLSTGKDTAILSFDDINNGDYPYGTLVQNPNDSLLYGLTTYGGANNQGVLFSVNPWTGKDSTRVTLDSLGNGWEPYQGSLTWYNNKYYGMIWAGGPSDSGVIFCFDPKTDKDSVVLNFTGANNKEYYPWGTHLTPYRGLLYAMTYNGGTSDSGTIFSFNPKTGKDSVIVSLNNATGGYPEEGELILNPQDSLLYSVNYSGGTADSGTLFSFDPRTGAYNVLVNFNDSLGANPAGDLLYNSKDGKFYGMTTYGGIAGNGVIYSFDPSTQKDSVLFAFNGTNGANPDGNLTIGPDGLLYGVTAYGGTVGGVIFSFDPSTGNETVLSNMDNNTGYYPEGSLTLVQLSPAATALNFDGVNDFASSNIFSTKRDTITLEARVNWNGTTGANEMIINNGNSGNSGYSIFVNHSNADKLSVVIGGVAVMSSTASLTQGTWQMVSLVRNNGTWTLYVDGVAHTLTPNTSNPAPVVGKFTIGANQGGTENFNGTIDEVRFWGRALCQDEINSHLSCQLTGNEPGLIALYHFNQGNAADDNITITTLADSSGNGNNLTLNNFALSGSVSNFIAPVSVLNSFCGPYTPPTPTVTPSGNLAICQGDSVTLTATVGSAYSWTGGATTQSITVKTGAAYQVAVTDPNGCYGTSSSSPVTVTVNSLPIITVTGKDTLHQAVNDTLKATGGVSYVWTSGSTSDTTLVSPSVTTTYTVTGTDGNGCSDTASFRVVVDIITGINTVSLSGSTSVYPNPANAAMNLSFNAAGSSPAILKVVDMNGAEILTENITISNGKVMSVDISKLATGSYFVKIITTKNTQVVKFVKERNK
jgi:uncharacterized repeat protein (TIGR03803 family)